MMVTTHFMNHKMLLKTQEKFYTFITKNMIFIYFNNFILLVVKHEFSLIFKYKFVVQNCAVTLILYTNNINESNKKKSQSKMEP